MEAPVFTEYLDTPLGLLCLRASRSALISLSPAREKGEIHPNDITRRAVLQLTEYFLKKRQEFSIELAPQGTPFQRRVWEIMRDIPYGKVVSYGQLAAAIGQESACRAAAGAVGKNPLPIFLPCHRVVAAGGLGGFLWGSDAKRLLLALEGVEIPKKTAFSEKFFFTFP